MTTLYLLIIDGAIHVSAVDPDTEESYESLLSNCFLARMPDARQTPAEIQINVVRNVLLAAGATVIIRE